MRNQNQARLSAEKFDALMAYAKRLTTAPAYSSGGTFRMPVRRVHPSNGEVCGIPICACNGAAANRFIMISDERVGICNFAERAFRKAAREDGLGEYTDRIRVLDYDQAWKREHRAATSGATPTARSGLKSLARRDAEKRAAGGETYDQLLFEQVYGAESPIK